MDCSIGRGKAYYFHVHVFIVCDMVLIIFHVLGVISRLVVMLSKRISGTFLIQQFLLKTVGAD